MPLEKHSIASAVQTRYPHFTSAQCIQIADEIVKQTARAIRDGKHLAHIEELPGGDVEISVFDVVEKIVNRVISE